jgi:uncharacterized protein YegJ (DUF2314 family)
MKDIARMVTGLVTGLALAAGLHAPGWAQTISDQAAKDEVVHMSREEPAMRRAFEQAGATLPEFLKQAANPKAGTTGHALKVAVSDARNTEYFWVNQFSNEGDVFRGTLNNTPRLVRKVQRGEVITFNRNQIADWVYMDEAAGRMMGNFTACALLTKEPAEQAASFKRKYGLSCPD